MWRDTASGTELELLENANISLGAIREGWDLAQHRDVEQRVVPMMARVSKFVAAQKKCAEKIELMFVARKIVYDPIRMQEFIDQAKPFFDAQSAKLFDEIVVDQKIELNNLLNCFAAILTCTKADLSQMQPMNANRLSVKANVLSSLTRKLDTAMMRMNATKREYDIHCANPEDSDEPRPIDQLSNLTDRIKGMLINTPPIVEAKMRQPTATKRPRIFSVESTADCCALGARNLTISTLSDEALDLVPSPKKFRNCTMDSSASSSMLSIPYKSAMKPKATEVLRSIQMRKCVDAMKSTRRTIMPQSIATLTGVRDHATHSEAEPNESLPRSSPDSPRDGSKVRTRKRLSLDGPT